VSVLTPDENCKKFDKWQLKPEPDGFQQLMRYTDRLVEPPDPYTFRARLVEGLPSRIQKDLLKNGFTPHTRGKIIGSKELLKQALLAEWYLELNPSEGNSEGKSKSQAKSLSQKAEKSSHANSSKSRKDTKMSSTPCLSLTSRKTPQPESHSLKTKSTSHWRNNSSSAPMSMAKKSDACYRCSGIGHKIAQCPHPDNCGVSAKAMCIDSDASSEEGSDSESFHESPVEASSDENSSEDEGSDTLDLSSRYGLDSDASNDHLSNTSTHDNSDRSGTEKEGEDDTSPPTNHSEGKELNDSSSEDSKGSGNQTDGSYLSFDPGVDSSIYKDETIQSTLAPMFAQTTGDTETRTSSKEGELQSLPAGEPTGGTSVPPEKGDLTESPEVHSS
jgi:hypothetical protein